jgi:DNA-binding GntR family transcriptional regulator
MRLKEDLFTGVIPPASKLKVKDLSDRYDVSATSIREALSHLAATGVIDQLPQRGFVAPKIDAANWLDLTRTRQIIEREAFRLAMENGDSKWEDEIVTSYSLLIREIERVCEGKTSTISQFFERHSQFHRALVSACPVQGLKGFIDDVYLRMGIYRRLTFMEGFPKDYLIEEHKNLMQAAMARNIGVALEAMAEHINHNSETLAKVVARYT